MSPPAPPRRPGRLARTLATLTAVTLLAGTVLVLAPAPRPAGAATGWPSETRTAEDLVRWINRDRAARGLGPVRWDPHLESLAAGWANELGRRGSLAHRPNLGAHMSGYEGWAENVGVAASGSAGDLYRRFFSSASHRRNMFDPGFDRVGVGVACGWYRGRPTFWVVMDFAASRHRPSGVTPASNPGPTGEHGLSGDACGRLGAPVTAASWSGGSPGSVWHPYGAFRGGVEVALGDLDGNGRDEIVTAPGPGGGPHVQAFDRAGRRRAHFHVYPPRFTGGVRVATADVDGDGRDEIVTAPGPGGGPHVRVFELSGRVVDEFLAYDRHFTGGIDVGGGDVDGDGRDEIVTAPGPGGGPHVRVFGRGGREVAGAWPYPHGFRGGVAVAAGDLDGDGRAEVVTGAGPGGGPHVVVLDGAGRRVRDLLAYPATFRGGVDVAVRAAGAGRPGRIVTAPGAGGGPDVRTFDAGGVPVRSASAYRTSFRGGVRVAAGRDELVASAAGWYGWLRWRRVP